MGVFLPKETNGLGKLLVVGFSSWSIFPLFVRKTLVFYFIHSKRDYTAFCWQVANMARAVWSKQGSPVSSKHGIRTTSNDFCFHQTLKNNILLFCICFHFSSFSLRLGNLKILLPYKYENDFVNHSLVALCIRIRSRGVCESTGSLSFRETNGP